MKYLFSDTAKKVLESLAFTQTLYAFDFDGTLAPIVAQPEAAKANRETELLLKELSNYATVVIISGRSVSDLKEKIAFPARYLIGNHGLESLNVKKKSIDKAKTICQKWSKCLQTSWTEFEKDAGVQIENKTYSLALHYRNSRNKTKARAILFSLIEKLDPPPRVILGKCVMNLVPAGGPHKGIALLEAMMLLNFKCAFYIGDDDTDEDVFSLPDTRIITARVGLKNSSQAQFFLKRQSEMNRLLRNLIKINKEGS